MPLHSRVIDMHDAQECIQGDVANILVIVHQEPAQVIHSEDLGANMGDEMKSLVSIAAYPQARLGLDVHDGKHGFIEDRVAHVLAVVGIGRDLSENVIHDFTCVRIVVAQDTQQS